MAYVRVETKKAGPDFAHERRLLDAGAIHVAGIDEVGRGDGHRSRQRARD